MLTNTRHALTAKCRASSLGNSATNVRATTNGVGRMSRWIAIASSCHAAMRMREAKRSRRFMVRISVLLIELDPDAVMTRLREQQAAASTPGASCS